jgi:hypothetical protein
MKRRYWTEAECSIIREFYPIGGVRACVCRLVWRNARSIHMKAHDLSVNAPGYGGPRTRWEDDPEIDARIRRLHERPMR